MMHLRYASAGQIVRTGFRWTVLALAIVLLSGCFHAFFYRGDGRLVDNGVLAYSRRYVVDLGPIDLSATGKHMYQLSGLPYAQFNVSICVTEDQEYAYNAKRDYPVTVRMTMENERNEHVILEEDPLNSWVRTSGFRDKTFCHYRRGITEDIPLQGGGARPERRKLKASGGWGTYFDSEYEEKYTLVVDVVSSPLKQKAHLQLIGWDR